MDDNRFITVGNLTFVRPARKENPARRQKTPAYPKLLFDEVNMLVHPFFAHEWNRRGQDSGGLKTVKGDEVFKDYQFLGILDSWREKIVQTKRNPSAILVFVGVGSLRLDKLLTKSELAKFSEAYQSLLRFAKKTLGRRVVIVNGSLWGRQTHVEALLDARNLVPRGRVRITSFGEFLSRLEEDVFCVKGEQIKLAQILKENFPKIRLKLKQLGTKKGKIYSLHQTTTLPAAAITREAIQKGYLTTAFVKRRLSHHNQNPSEYARQRNLLISRTRR